MSLLVHNPVDSHEDLELFLKLYFLCGIFDNDLDKIRMLPAINNHLKVTN